MKNNGISLSAPRIASGERKKVEAAKTTLESATQEVARDVEKVTKLREKEKELRKAAGKLQRDAAAFHGSDAELQLLANQKQLERLLDSIRQAESECFDAKIPLFRAIDEAQQLVQRLCQPTYNELIDQIGAQLAPYYRNFLTARWEGRNSEAARDLPATLLNHRCLPDESIEKLSVAAKDVLRKLDALLSGGEIYRFEGAEVPSSAASAT